MNNWRDDRKCGSEILLSHVTESVRAPVGCNPEGPYPCCTDHSGFCRSTSESCSCTACTDYRRKWRQPQENCTITRIRGFLKKICFDQQERKYHYECPYSNMIYKQHGGYENGTYHLNSVSKVCGNDPYAYQACGFNPDISSESDFLCGGYFNSSEGDNGFDFMRNDHVIPEDNNSSLSNSSDPNSNRIDVPTPASNSTNSNGGNTDLPTPVSNSTDPKDAEEELPTPVSNATDPKDAEEELSTPVSNTTDPEDAEEELPTPVSNSTDPDSHGNGTERLCDDDCGHLSTCRDESDCNGYFYGMTCLGKFNQVKYISIDSICGGSSYCLEDDDEQNCNDTDSDPNAFSCFHYGTKLWKNEEKRVRIFNFTRCGVFDLTARNFPYCLDFTDQTNCSDPQRVGGQCFIDGFMSNVSKYVVCDDPHRKTLESVQLCDDHLEDACTSPSETSDCNVHKHRWCDDVVDCPDGSDEVHDDCSTTTAEHFKCHRAFGDGRNLSIPISWILDNQTDCKSGEDEKRDWLEFCGSRKDGSYRVILGGEDCQNVFLCPSSEKPFVIFDLLCDGIESCGIENEACQISRGFPEKNTTTPVFGKVRDLCFNQEDLKDKPCKVQYFEKAYGDVFGVTTLIKVPSSKVDCTKIFGEYYVYLSCMGLCNNTNSTCPLKNIPLNHDSCPGQYHDRVYTLANNSFLTFVTESDTGQYENDFFQCDNSKCIKYSQVCDLVNDCGDGSDEQNCNNHMVCEDSKSTSSKQFISRSQKCDGIYDCFDLSDECNDECGKEILENLPLKVICWVLGVLAILLNALMIVKSALSLKESKTGSMLCTKSLISLVGVGDMMIGVYLVVLSIFDTFIYSENFCRNQAEWLSSHGCMLLGVISTSASELSLFAMTALSFIRMLGVSKNSMTAPAPVNKRAVFRTISLVTAILIASLAVATVPLIPQLEDYFVQGLFYDRDYKVFVGFPNKAKHVEVLQTYFNTTDITVDTTWKVIGEKVDSMFSQSNGSLTRRAVHFYGNDAVCLFKYFVRNDDPTRSKTGEDIIDYKGNIVVWLMLVLNLLCFAVITVSYVLIARTARVSSRNTGQDRNPEIAQQNKTLQRKVLIIITTDFFCWVPFIFICAFHSLKWVDATGWYATFAMIVLPLNSVINPVLYDNTIEQFFRKTYRKSKLRMSSIYGSLRNSVREARARITETLELDDVETRLSEQSVSDIVVFRPHGETKA